MRKYLKNLSDIKQQCKICIINETVELARLAFNYSNSLSTFIMGTSSDWEVPLHEKVFPVKMSAGLIHSVG